MKSPSKFCIQMKLILFGEGEIAPTICLPSSLLPYFNIDSTRQWCYTLLFLFPIIRGWDILVSVNFGVWHISELPGSYTRHPSTTWKERAETHTNAEGIIVSLTEHT